MSTTETGAGRQLTGRHVFLITASAFAVIIAVNVTMAVKAVSTFPGLEVKNSYVASQAFEARRDAQEALGWATDAEIRDGRQLVTLTGPDGAPIVPAELTALLGRPTNASEDQTPALAFDGEAFVAPVQAGPGLWTLKLTAVAEDGTLFQKRLTVRAK